MPRRIWNLSEIRVVAERYPEEGPSRLAALLDRSEDSVSSLARRYGLKSLHRHARQAGTRASRNVTVDRDFFDTPSPAVAHVLGFLFGRGTVKTRARKVIRLRCPVAREPALRRVLDLMGSGHALQRGRRRILVEIGNARLVDSLLANCGRAPSRDDPDPPFPPIDRGLLPHFARGLWDAAGELRMREIRCTGSPRLIGGLCRAIAESTGHAPASVSEASGRMTAVWNDLVETQAVRRWLARAGDRDGRPDEAR